MPHQTGSWYLVVFFIIKKTTELHCTDIYKIETLQSLPSPANLLQDQSGEEPQNHRMQTEVLQILPQTQSSERGPHGPLTAPHTNHGK